MPFSFLIRTQPPLYAPPNIKSLYTSLAAAVLAVLAPTKTITEIFNTVNPDANIKGTFDNSTLNPYSSSVANFTSTAGLFDAFCAEPLQPINFGETLVYQLQSPFSLTKADQVARLVTAYLAYSQTLSEAAATQWAIWEVSNETLLALLLFNGNTSITTPTFASTQVLADQHLANIYNFAPGTIVHLANVDRQDFNVRIPALVAIPEPTSLLLCTISGLGLLRRRIN